MPHSFAALSTWVASCENGEGSCWRSTARQTTCICSSKCPRRWRWPTNESAIEEAAPEFLLPRLISGELRLPGGVSNRVREPEGRKGLAQGVSPGTAGKQVEPRNGA